VLVADVHDLPLYTQRVQGTRLYRALRTVIFPDSVVSCTYTWVRSGRVPSFEQRSCAESRSKILTFEGFLQIQSSSGSMRKRATSGKWSLTVSKNTLLLEAAFLTSMISSGPIISDVAVKSNTMRWS
jgi:hypothetical protein